MEPKSIEQYQSVVLSIIDKAKDFISAHLPTIQDNQKILYTVIVNENKGYQLLAEQPDLPVDPIDHPHKNRTHFYVMLIRGTSCYEGYVYLLNPNFHFSLIRVLQDDAFRQRVTWLDQFQ